MVTMAILHVARRGSKPLSLIYIFINCFAFFYLLLLKQNLKGLFDPEGLTKL